MCETTLVPVLTPPDTLGEPLPVIVPETLITVLFALELTVVDPAIGVNAKDGVSVQSNKFGIHRSYFRVNFIFQRNKLMLRTKFHSRYFIRQLLETSVHFLLLLLESSIHFLLLLLESSIHFLLLLLETSGHFLLLLLESSIHFLLELLEIIIHFYKITNPLHHPT